MAKSYYELRKQAMEMIENQIKNTPIKQQQLCLNISKIFGFSSNFTLKHIAQLFELGYVDFDADIVSWNKINEEKNNQIKEEFKTILDLKGD